MESTDPLSSGEALGFLLLLVLLLFLSALFSGSETALTSLGVHELKDILTKKEGKEKDKIRSLIHRSNRMLTTILIANNTVNILATSVATLLVIRFFPVGEGITAGITTLIMTILIVIFGEITPKVYARNRSEAFLRKTKSLLTAVGWLMKPMSWGLLKLSNVLIRLVGGNTADEVPILSEDYIMKTLEVGHEVGVIELEQRNMLKGTLMMRDTSVKEIMTPRVDMVCVKADQTLRELVDIVNEEGYSRIPVYEDNIDNILGVCYAKDVFKVIEKDGVGSLKDTKVREIMREPLFIPETMKIDDLMREFRTRKVHIAIVVDEFGGTAGLVTMEDIIEELTGQIFDEYDEEEEEPTLLKLKEGVYIVDASIPINDLERELGIEFPKTEFETLAGYLLEVFERFPKVGEEVEVNGFRFKILAATRNRIDRVRMEVLKESE